MEYAVAYRDPREDEDLSLERGFHTPEDAFNAVRVLRDIGMERLTPFILGEDLMGPLSWQYVIQHRI